MQHWYNYYFKKYKAYSNTQKNTTSLLYINSRLTNKRYINTWYFTDPLDIFCSSTWRCPGGPSSRADSSGQGQCSSHKTHISPKKCVYSTVKDSIFMCFYSYLIFFFFTIKIILWENNNLILQMNPQNMTIHVGLKKAWQIFFSNYILSYIACVFWVGWVMGIKQKMSD